MRNLNPPCKAVIDLSAIRDNYKTLSSLVADANCADCAAVIKANAYGLNAGRIARELFRVGARTFYVAVLSEAVELQTALPSCDDCRIDDCRIYVLEGNAVCGEEADFNHCIRPVINSEEQLDRWLAHHQSDQPQSGKNPAPCAVQVDLGMNRLGFSKREIAQSIHKLNALEIDTIVGHLSCAQALHHRMNETQLNRFVAIAKFFPNARLSLANSSGIFLGEKYLLDQVRPGAALYGINPTPGASQYGINPLKQVITLSARLVQIRQINRAETIGYDATYTSTAAMQIGTLSIGYADGYPRRCGGFATFKQQKAALLGRVSMDSIVVDLSEFAADACKVGDYFNLIDEQINLDLLAENADTIGYEILCRLGGRIQWQYINGSIS